MKKILALLLALLMVFSLAACGNTADDNNDDNKGNETLGMSASPLDAPEIKVDYEVKDDFKIGFICLHDEKSTYDKNFLDAANEVIKALKLTEDLIFF